MEDSLTPVQALVLAEPSFLSIGLVSSGNIIVDVETIFDQFLNVILAGSFGLGGLIAVLFTIIIAACFVFYSLLINCSYVSEITELVFDKLSNLFLICGVDMVQVIKRNDIFSRLVHLIKLTVMVSTFTALVVFSPSGRPVRRILGGCWPFKDKPQYGMIHRRSLTRDYIQYAHQQWVGSIHGGP
jgi:hypothetical protein